MENAKYLGGKAEIAIGSVTIGPEFLAEISPNFEEGVREVNSLAGVIKMPSGSFDTAEVTGQFIVPSMDALKALWAGAYEAPTGSAEDLSGRVRFGGNSCVSQEPVPVNIHYTCEPNSDNDVHINSGIVAMNFNPTYNDSDALTVEFTIYAQPSADGYGFAGAGDLTQKTIWDATTQSFIPVPDSE